MGSTSKMTDASTHEELQVYQTVAARNADLEARRSFLQNSIKWDDTFSLSSSLELIRQEHLERPKMPIEELVSALFESQESSDGLILDTSLTDNEFDQNVFDAMVSSEQITRMIILILPLEPGGNSENSCDTDTLERALNKMNTVKALCFRVGPVTQDQANEICGALVENSASNVTVMCWNLRNCADVGAASTILQCVGRMSSSLCHLVLDPPDSAKVPLEKFASFCDDFSQSSLECLFLHGSPVKGHDNKQAAVVLSHAIMSCSSLIDFAMPINRLVSEASNESRAELFRLATESLRQHEAVKNSNACFFRYGYQAKNRPLVPSLLYLQRSCWWKQALSLDMRSGLWPFILAKAAKWTTPKRSHSSQDIIFFLLREKNDVLLQDVRRRRRRKRKLFQITT